jgi:3-hydroxybutyryl-CoA dehydrogenase
MKNIQVIGIVGAGQMGRGIAQVAAQTGFEVVLFDAFKNSLDFGHNFIKTQLAKGVEKAKWTEKNAEEAFRKIKPTLDLSDLKNCDLIIEAATEKKELKFEIFKRSKNKKKINFKRDFK